MPLKAKGIIAIVIVAAIVCAGVAWALNQSQQITTYRLIIGDGRPGSAGWIQDAALAKACERHNVGLEITVMASTGSVENVNMLAEGKIHIGMVTLGTAIQAYKGVAPFNKSIDIRILAVRQINYLYIVTLEETGIKSIYDLAGKRVAVNTPGSYNNIKAMALLRVAGLVDKVIAEALEWDQGLEALRDRRLDAVIMMVSGYTPQIQQLFALPGLRPKLIGLDQETRMKFLETYPGHILADIPPEMYGQGYVVPTIAEPSTYACMAYLPEDVAYRFIKVIYNYYKEMTNESVNWAIWTPDMGPAAKDAGVPYHPGAVKAYKEMKLWKD